MTVWQQTTHTQKKPKNEQKERASDCKRYTRSFKNEIRYNLGQIHGNVAKKLYAPPCFVHCFALGHWHASRNWNKKRCTRAALTTHAYPKPRCTRISTRRHQVQFIKAFLVGLHLLRYSIFFNRVYCGPSVCTCSSPTKCASCPSRTNHCTQPLSIRRVIIKFS